MALNKTIIKKINEKAEGNDSLKKCLVEILQLESKGRGWYTREYTKILETYYKGGEGN